MQTFLLRRTKGLANDQMRMMCAVIVVVLLFIAYNNQHNPHTATYEDNVVDYCISTTQTFLQNMQNHIIGENQIEVTPVEVGEDFLIEAGIETENVSLHERQMRIATSEKQLEVKRARAEKELAIREQIESITCDPTDIKKTSNMTTEQIGIMVKDTWLEGKEEVLHQIENDHDINVFFICAVGTLESQHGDSPRARSRSNYYGIENQIDYVSYENNTEHFADMINRVYVDSETIGSNIYDIGPVYCPPNPDWANIVVGMMQDKYDKIVDHEYKKIDDLTAT